MFCMFEFRITTDWNRQWLFGKKENFILPKDRKNVATWKIHSFNSSQEFNFMQHLLGQKMNEMLLLTTTAHSLQSVFCSSRFCLQSTPLKIIECFVKNFLLFWWIFNSNQLGIQRAKLWCSWFWIVELIVREIIG